MMTNIQTEGKSSSYLESKNKDEGVDDLLNYSNSNFNFDFND